MIDLDNDPARGPEVRTVPVWWQKGAGCLASHDQRKWMMGWACSLAVECEIIRLRLPAKTVQTSQIE